MADTEGSVVEELVGNAHGNLARVRELLDVHPAALNLKAPWNETAIEAATQMGDKPIIELLIGRGESAQGSSETKGEQQASHDPSSFRLTARPPYATLCGRG